MIKLKVDKVVEQQEIEIPTPYYAVVRSPDKSTYFKIEEKKVLIIEITTEYSIVSYKVSVDTYMNQDTYKDLLTLPIYRSQEDDFVEVFEETLDFVKQFEEN